MWDRRLEAGRLNLRNTRMTRVEVLTWLGLIGTFVCCAQRRFGRDRLQAIRPMVLCVCRFTCFLNVFETGVLDVTSCSHDSCQGPVLFAHLLCSGANPNTNGTVKFSLSPRLVQVRESISKFWNFWMCDLCVLVGVMCQRVFVEVLMESETKWPNHW